MVPEQVLERVTNLDHFLGILVFDKWTCQTDGRQAVLVPHSSSDPQGSVARLYRVMMIDQGLCFGGCSWGFPDAPLRGLYPIRSVYRNVTGIESFDPWLDPLESRLSLSDLYRDALQIPQEWYADDHSALARLVERLDARRGRVRDLIWAAHKAVYGAFPNWKGCVCPVSAKVCVGSPLPAKQLLRRQPPRQLRRT